MGLVTTTLQPEGWTLAGSSWMSTYSDTLTFQGGAYSSGSQTTSPFVLNQFSSNTSQSGVDLLHLMGLPYGNFYYYNINYGLLGIWSGIRSTVLSAYYNWLTYSGMDSSMDSSSSNLVIPDLTILFSLSTYTTLRADIMALVELLMSAGTAYIGYTELDNIANKIYNSYYSTELGSVYTQYRTNVDAVQEQLESNLSNLYILDPVALLFTDSTVVLSLLKTAAELTLETLRTYNAADFYAVYSAPLSYMLGFVRYYYSPSAIIDKINECLSAMITTADLQTFLEQELTPYSTLAMNAYNSAYYNFDIALAAAVEQLQQTMSGQYTTYIEELKLVLGTVYASRCATFLNIFCKLRPIAILTGLCYVPVDLSLLPGNYKPADTDILWTCTNAASYKEFITTCAAGVQTYQIYPVIPEYYALNNNSIYYPLYAMAADTDDAWFIKGATYYNAASNTSVGVFRYIALTEQTLSQSYPPPWSNINLVTISKYSYYSAADSTEASTDGSYVYGTLVALAELTLTNIWGISDGDMGTAGQLLDMQNIKFPVYVLCASGDPEYTDPSKIPTTYASEATLIITGQSASLIRTKDPDTGLAIPWQSGSSYNFTLIGLAFDTYYKNSETVIQVTSGGVTADVGYGLGLNESLVGELVTGTPGRFLIYADSIYVEEGEVNIDSYSTVTRKPNASIKFSVAMPTTLCGQPLSVRLYHHQFALPVTGPNISGSADGFTWLYLQGISIGSLLDQTGNVISIKYYPELTSVSQLLGLLPLELQ